MDREGGGIMKDIKFTWNNNRYLYKGGREFRIMSDGFGGGSVFYVTNEKMIDRLLEVVREMDDN